MYKKLARLCILQIGEVADEFLYLKVALDPLIDANTFIGANLAKINFLVGKMPAATPRIKGALSKIAILNELISRLPSEASLEQPAPFHAFTAQLSETSNTLKSMRRNNTFFDCDNMIKFLKGLAVIMTGVIPGLIFGAALNYFGVFNSTGENKVNKMQKILASATPSARI